MLWVFLHFFILECWQPRAFIASQFKQTHITLFSMENCIWIGGGITNLLFNTELTNVLAELSSPL